MLGVALLLFVFLDALWTTLWVDGSGGPLTSRTTTWAWHAVLAVFGRNHHQRLSLFGPSIIVMGVVTWVLLVWASSVLIYASDPDSLLHMRDPGGPADWTRRIWFVAYAISTMGNGGHTPNGDVWQIVASLTTLSGFFLASLVISYLLSVLAAVVAKRAFIRRFASAGSQRNSIDYGWRVAPATTYVWSTAMRTMILRVMASLLLLPLLATPAPAQVRRAAVGGATGVAGGAAVTLAAVVARARFQREYLESVDDLIHWQSAPMVVAPAAGVLFGLAGEDALKGSIVGSSAGLVIGGAVGAGLGWVFSKDPEGPWAGGVIGAGAGLAAGGLLGGLRAWSRDEDAELTFPDELRFTFTIPVP